MRPLLLLHLPDGVRRADPLAILHVDLEERAIALYQAARHLQDCRVYTPDVPPDRDRAGQRHLIADVQSESRAYAKLRPPVPF